VPGGIRTPNLLIRSQLLYPVELQTHFPEAIDKLREFSLSCKPAVENFMIELLTGFLQIDSHENRARDIFPAGPEPK
jgi:hypothetical protein